MDEIEFFRSECLVFPAPMDLMGAAGLLDDELILGRAPGIGPGAYHHRPQVGDEALLPGNDLLIQGRSGQVPVNRGNVSDALMRQIFLHLTPPALMRQSRNFLSIPQIIFKSTYHEKST